MAKRILALLAVLAVALGLFAGCGASGTRSTRPLLP